MKMAYLCARYLLSRGGAELHLQRLAEELIQRGHEITVFACEAPGRTAPDAPFRVEAVARDTAREEKIRRRLGWQQRRGGYRLGRWLFRSGLQQILGLGPVCPGILDVRRYEPFDVVTLFNGGTAWTAQFPKALPKLKHKVTAAVPLFHVREEFANWPAQKKLHRDYSVIITNTPFEAAWLGRRGWGEQRLHPVGVGSDPFPEAVDPRAFRRRHALPEAAPLVLFIGRKIYNKGVPHLIQAMDEIRGGWPDARLALVGFSHNPTTWLDSLLDHAKPDARSNTINLDDVNDREREEALAACDLLCVPSISDSFGIAYLDAWRHAKPVIGCRGTGCESVIAHGKDGLLVEFGNVPGLAAALRALLENAGRRRQLGEQGREKWRARYRWELMAEKTEKIFLGALDHV